MDNTASANYFIIAVGLGFSPIKFVILTVWLFSCFYIVQYLTFSPLVSRKYKTASYVISLIAGPILVAILFLRDVIKVYTGSNIHFWEDLRSGWGGGIRNVPLVQRILGTKDRLELLDSSGKEISDIYNRRDGDRYIVDFARKIVGDALEDNASDITVTPKDGSSYDVRYKVDGLWRLGYNAEAVTCKGLLNSIKAISQMDIAEKRKPQDGSFRARIGDRNYSFRVATAGVRNGEKLTIRVLNQNLGEFTLDNIGLSEGARNRIREASSENSGMILICGPTGSGKTTTLYAMLNEMDLYTRNLVTVEDPVEYVLDNASQIEVKPKAGITFAGSIRSILRQAPDVICVGEIRDTETAKIALQASHTGHLVLATIHCRSNAEALVRLRDLGVSPEMVTSGLSMLISQRLVRKLCDNCKQPAELTDKQRDYLRKLRVSSSRIYAPVGCDSCDGTGYSGRIGVYDVLKVEGDIKKVINKDSLLDMKIREKVDHKCRANMRKKAQNLVLKGLTSFDEVSRAVGR
jgi:type II secretory ATPase GspE/PulE/Tfp pilus assembly ATPase PilB-like protein